MEWCPAAGPGPGRAGARADQTRDSDALDFCGRIRRQIRIGYSGPGASLRLTGPPAARARATDDYRDY